MYNGDRARKERLVDFGFRLPSAMDNRPQKEEEVGRGRAGPCRAGRDRAGPGDAGEGRHDAGNGRLVPCSCGNDPPDAGDSRAGP